MKIKNFLVSAVIALKILCCFSSFACDESDQSDPNCNCDMPGHVLRDCPNHHLGNPEEQGDDEDSNPEADGDDDAFSIHTDYSTDEDENEDEAEDEAEDESSGDHRAGA